LFGVGVIIFVFGLYIGKRSQQYKCGCNGIMHINSKLLSSSEVIEQFQNDKWRCALSIEKVARGNETDVLEDANWSIKKTSASRANIPSSPSNS